MKWSLDVKFENRIKPAALSAILESHLSTVTAIQWIHPMNKVSPFRIFRYVIIPIFSNQTCIIKNQYNYIELNQVRWVAIVLKTIFIIVYLRKKCIKFILN